MSDNGKGIPHDQQDNVFEPFYTTREQGKGTGLGLAMVFGFVKRSKGFIRLYSEPDIGTTFSVYLPRDRKAIANAEDDPRTDEVPRGNELLLLVDDELSLVNIAAESLQSLGYRILTATNGEQALEQLANNPDIALLFSDVVMPGNINGFELAEKVGKMYPKIKIILTSGYSEKVVAHNDQIHFQTGLLNKPYTLADLAKNIRQQLDKDIDNT